MKRLVLGLTAIGSILVPVATARAEAPTAGTIELRIAPPTAQYFTAAAGEFTGLVVGDPDTTFLMGLGGAGGYFVTDNIELGGEAALGVVAVDGGNLFSFYLGPTGRYVIPLGGPVNAWGEGKLGLAIYRGSFDNAFGRTHSSTLVEFRLGAFGGVDFHLHSNVALYAGAGVDLYLGDAVVVPLGIIYGLRGYL